MSDETIKEVLETLDIAPVEAPAPEAPLAEPTVPAEPPVAAQPAVEPASPPAVPPAALVEPPAQDFTGEPTTPPVVPVAPPVAATPDPRDLEIEALRAQIVEYSKRAMATPPPSPPAAPIPVAAPIAPVAPVAPVAPISPVDVQFFKDEAEVDAALKDAGSFNKFLNNFVRAIEPIITQKAVFQAAQMIPEVSMNVANDQISMLSTVKSWYDSNPDLLPFKEFCGVIAKEITAKEPQITMVDALNKTESEVRSRLRLVKPTTIAPVASGGAPPASPGFTPGGRSGGGGQPPTLDKVQQDIANTILD